MLCFQLRRRSWTHNELITGMLSRARIKDFILAGHVIRGSIYSRFQRQLNHAATHGQRTRHATEAEFNRFEFTVFYIVKMTHTGRYVDKILFCYYVNTAVNYDPTHSKTTFIVVKKVTFIIFRPVYFLTKLPQSDFTYLHPVHTFSWQSNLHSTNMCFTHWRTDTHIIITWRNLQLLVSYDYITTKI